MYTVDPGKEKNCVAQHNEPTFLEAKLAIYLIVPPHDNGKPEIKMLLSCSLASAILIAGRKDSLK